MSGWLIWLFIFSKLFSLYALLGKLLLYWNIKNNWKIHKNLSSNLSQLLDGPMKEAKNPFKSQLTHYFQENRQQIYLQVFQIKQETLHHRLKVLVDYFTALFFILIQLNILYWSYYCEGISVFHPKFKRKIRIFKLFMIYCLTDRLFIQLGFFNVNVW